MEIDELIKSVKNRKKFKSKKPDWRDIIDAIDLTRYTPTAGDQFNLKFIIVDDDKKIQDITDHTQQLFVSQTHYLVVVCSETKRLQNSYGEEADKYMRQQAGAAIQNFLLKLEELGLSSCWVRLFHEQGIRDVLKIPDDVVVEAVLPIGYEFTKPRTREAKINIDRILFFNKYGNRKMNPPKTAEGY